MVLAGAPTEVSIPAVEALVRWDPAWFADRELDERRELSLPPAARLAVLTGPRPALEAATAELDLPAARQPCSGRCRTASTDRWRTLVTVPRPDGPALARELAAMRARASARKDPDPVSVRVDPPDPTA